MKKQSKLIIILLAVLVLAVGGLIAVKKLAANEAEEETEPALTAFSADMDSITSVSWKNPGTELCVLADDSGKWHFIEDKKFPLDSQIVEEMLYAVSNVEASVLVTEKTDDLGQYGLADPDYRIVLKTKSGEVPELYVGSYNSGAGAYYFRSSESDSVYLVGSTLPDTFGKGLFDLAEKEDIPEIDGFTAMTVKTEKGEITVTAATSGYTVEVNGEKKAVDPEKAETIESELAGFGWDSCVSYTGDLENFGLDKPFATLHIDFLLHNGDDEEAAPCDLDLLFGSVTDDGKRYACIKDSSMIYTVDENSVVDLLITDPAELVK